MISAVNSRENSNISVICNQRVLTDKGGIQKALWEQEHFTPWTD